MNKKSSKGHLVWAYGGDGKTRGGQKIMEGREGGVRGQRGHGHVIMGKR